MRQLYYNSTQVGDQLISFRYPSIERGNTSTSSKQDSKTVHVETTSPNFVYRAVAIIIVSKDTDDLFQAYVNGTMVPRLVAVDSAIAAEWEDNPSLVLKRSMADARFDGAELTDVPQWSLGAHDYGIRIYFTSAQPIVEVS